MPGPPMKRLRTASGRKQSRKGTRKTYEFGAAGRGRMTTGWENANGMARGGTTFRAA